MGSKTDNRLFVIAYDEQGRLTWTGRVEREDQETVRMECYDAMDLALIGQFSLSGELKDVPRERCRLFKNFDAFNGAAQIGVGQNWRAARSGMTEIQGQTGAGKVTERQRGQTRPGIPDTTGPGFCTRKTALDQRVTDRIYFTN